MSYAVPFGYTRVIPRLHICLFLAGALGLGLILGRPLAEGSPDLGDRVAVHATSPDHFNHTTPQRVYMLYDPVEKRYLSSGKGLGNFNWWVEKSKASIWISKKEADDTVKWMFGIGRRAEVHAFVLLPVHLREDQP